MFILQYRSRTVTQYTLTYNQQLQCCSGYGPKPNCLRTLYLLLIYIENIISQNLYAAICSPSCGTNKQCTAPDTCTCISGWTGNDCLTGMITYISI